LEQLEYGGGFLKKLGRNNLNILEENYSQQLLQWVISQMMRIEIWNGSSWLEQHRAAEAAASTKGNNMVILLNLTGINTSTLKIRFRSIAGVQGVDYAWIDYSADEPINITEIAPSQLIGGDIEKILNDDGNYLVINKGDEFYVEFPEIESDESLTFLIHDNGYYLHNFDTYVEYTQQLDEWLNEIFGNELYAARYFMPKFYSSYYEGHHTIYTDYVKVDINGVENLNTGEWYDTIQAAIENASDGDTIKVYPGEYDGPIVVNKCIKLVG